LPAPLTLSADLPPALAHVRWIGGAPDAGKTTLAHLLGERYGLSVYSCDDHEDERFNDYSQNPAAFIHRWVKLSVDERFIEHPPQLQADNVMRIETESLPYVVRDLLAMPKDGLIVVEGNLLPTTLAPYLSAAQQAVFLVPSDAFRQASFYRRGKHEGHRERSDPDRALQNHLERDRLIGQRVRAEAQSQNLTLLEINENLSEEAIADAVARHFGLVSSR
jgi:hypothetical protein